MDTNKLRGLIVEKFGTQQRFAAELGISNSSMTRILDGKQDLRRSVIEKIIIALGMSGEEVTRIFFAGAVA